MRRTVRSTPPGGRHRGRSTLRWSGCVAEEGTMAATTNTNSKYELRGFNHIALVCRDMAETVQWYEEKLGMRLVKTLQFPDGGQHFFLDMGNGVDGIAFFWFPDAPEGTPGDSTHGSFDDQMRRVGNGITAIGTTNH